MVASPVKVAVLDDYQNVALQMTDWSPLQSRATVTVFNDHISDPDLLVERLAPFEVVCVMRERTPLPRAILERLPNLKLIASTAIRNASIDATAAAERGIPIAITGYDSTPTIELTWALILAALRHIAPENASLRGSGWQRAIGEPLANTTLAVLGLGNIGSEVARIALAFRMRVIAWSQNLTEERAAAAGAELVSKDELFRQADVLTIHLA
jgi:phosphoglycerate dehydrogenase-like enzyme